MSQLNVRHDRRMWRQQQSRSKYREHTTDVGRGGDREVRDNLCYCCGRPTDAPSPRSLKVPGSWYWYVFRFNFLFLCNREFFGEKIRFFHIVNMDYGLWVKVQVLQVAWGTTVSVIIFSIFSSVRKIVEHWSNSTMPFDWNFVQNITSAQDSVVVWTSWNCVQIILVRIRKERCWNVKSNVRMFIRTRPVCALHILRTSHPYGKWRLCKINISNIDRGTPKTSHFPVMIDSLHAAPQRLDFVDPQKSALQFSQHIDLTNIVCWCVRQSVKSGVYIQAVLGKNARQILTRETLLLCILTLRFVTRSYLNTRQTNSGKNSHLTLWTSGAFYFGRPTVLEKKKPWTTEMLSWP